MPDNRGPETTPPGGIDRKTIPAVPKTPGTVISPKDTLGIIPDPNKSKESLLPDPMEKAQALSQDALATIVRQEAERNMRDKDELGRIAAQEAEQTMRDKDELGRIAAQEAEQTMRDKDELYRIEQTGKEHTGILSDLKNPRHR